MKKFTSISLAIMIGVMCILGDAQKVYAQDVEEPEQEVEKVVVALDPGHDAIHGGATRVGLLEHELTLKIANYCKEELEKCDNIEVYMTREDNECPYPYVSGTGKCIRERMYAAYDAGASFYVSIHLNAQDGGTGANGAEVYHQNMNWKPDVGLKGKTLAQMIQDELVALGLKDRGIASFNTTIGERYPDGSVSDYYSVHIYGKECGIPGVIVENAFISNANDRNNFLTTEAGLKKLGVANAKAIAKMVGERIGWVYENNQWYYYANGVAQTGWILDGNTWYYMNEEGVMQIGWLLDGGAWYYLRGNGAMATGWQKVNGTWYYMNKSGAMLTGWQYVEGEWYCLNESGAMQMGWIRDGELWYYLHGSGVMATGWLKLNGTWYYLNASGAMAIGWKYINGCWYYMMESGKMVSGEYEIEGEIYRFANDGSWIKS